MIETLMGDVVFKNIDSSKYFWNGLPVPRVTHILSEMLHEDYLMKWSNYLGLIKRTRYETELNRSSYIGTQVHDYIQKYIESKVYKDQTQSDTEHYKEINNAVNSFKLWYNDVKSNDIEIVGIEQQLICPWFGGTYDLLIRINGRLFLGDFKTSNYISYKYFLQLSAYRYILSTIHNINVDGCLILQFDKKQVSYEEYFIDFSIKDNLDMMNLGIETFLSLVYSYYNRLEFIKKYDQFIVERRKSI